MNTSQKFETIYKTMKEEDNQLNVGMPCDIAGISRSGYYRYIDAEDVREERNRADFEMVLKAYKQRGYSKGARGIYMCLLRFQPPVVMDLKKIRRLV